LKQKTQIDEIIKELRCGHDNNDEAIRQHKNISTIHDLFSGFATDDY